VNSTVVVIDVEGAFGPLRFKGLSGLCSYSFTFLSIDELLVDVAF
jgi:hypothetical protein